MMKTLFREDVCIVLNEREPLKRQMASELESALQGRGYSVYREKPSPLLVELLKERRPRLAVLDYLLGDEGTVLDVLTALREESASRPFEVIVWTDEPSVSVAVGAIRLGAYDYVEAPGLPNTNRILQAVEDALSQAEEIVDVQPPCMPLVAQDATTVVCLNQTRAAARQATAVCVLFGARGTGRNSIARYYHEARRHPGSFFEIDWDSYPSLAHTVFGDEYHTVPLLSAASTVFIDHAEFDECDLLNAGIAWAANKQSSDPTAAPRLVIGTTDQSVARAWARIVEAPVIALPLLSERKGDLLPLLQRFTIGFRNQKHLRAMFNAQSINQIAAWSWPGNVRQLRASFYEAASIFEASEDTPQVEDFLTWMLNAKNSWERFNEFSSAPVDPQQARSTIDRCGGNLRAAAARLATGIPQLRHLLRITPQEIES